ncbi:MAG: signal peptidase I [Clostridiales bacterium]|nr:signal peptidase I [Clostridiales bacterium]
MSATQQQPADTTAVAIDNLRQRHRGRQRLRGTIITLIVAAAIVFLAFGVVLKIAVVRGKSMLPTVQNDDLIFAWRLQNTFQSGDIVLFRAGDTELVKRVIGVPGDSITVEPRTGRLLVNGEIADEEGSITLTTPRPGAVTYPLELGENEYFLLGDNRLVSEDSRFFGPVSGAVIDGRVILLIRAKVGA